MRRRSRADSFGCPHPQKFDDPQSTRTRPGAMGRERLGADYDHRVEVRGAGPHARDDDAASVSVSQAAKYKGSGDTNDAGSFVCVSGK